ncbi:uncharacterized protein LOC107636637 [Arachis ipaensis]|uniref:uncharacterized protein LOC107636637 n=1 Tax=Arachis ipaensis TaxID=130454 RepID=UPI0007AEF3BD|nr:uncharacterized protein LOC107636637 [Arachis ipaensis]XP_025647759.1 uncharacterized protein LOC112742744 [Arachis hypogaea]
MVQEFYANAWVTKKHDTSVNPDPKYWHTMVRGQIIDFSLESVRMALQLPQSRADPQSFTRRVNSDQRLEQVLTDICVVGAQWRRNAQGKPYQLGRLDLKPVARGWLEFIQLPILTKINPREEYKAISLRSERVVGKKNEQAKAPLDVEEEKEKEKNHAQPYAPKEKETLKQYEPRIPFCQRLKKENKEKQYSKFLEVFRKLQINIPFIEALKQICLYIKFMKELLSKKKTLRKDETMVMTKECSAVIQRDFPRKMKDPASFQIPCTIGSTTFEKALCDLGESINLMPLSVMKKLQIKEVKLTDIALQMVDRSLKYAHGVVENILVKVKNFFLPSDFVILDMEEDENAFIILGRPFLVTGRALIDVEKGELMLT